MENIDKRLTTLEEKVNKVYESVEKTRKYFLWTMIISVAVIVIPLIVLMFVLPSFISNYTSSLSGAGL